MTEKPIGYELRHVTYCTSRRSEDDMLVIKEYQHFADGRRIPNVRLIENMERPLWITKKGERNYTENQQAMREEYLDMYKSTQATLYRQINRVLGTRYKSNHDAFKSPFVFGCGTSPETYLKSLYFRKYEKFITPSSTVAVADTETDVVDGTGEIVLFSITMQDKAYCVITEQYLRGTPKETFLQRTRQICDELLADVKAERNITFEFEVVENAGQAVVKAINKAHEWKPDFLEFWNIDFDMQRMIEALDKYGYDKADVFSDPSVPREYRFFRYQQGTALKPTQSGKLRSLANFERWHKVFTPSSFFMVCGMSTYYQLRIAKGKIPGGYSLEATLNRHLKRGKLKFSECDHLVKIAWHKKMQRDYPYQYIAYNLFDCIGVEMLDNEIKDVGMKFNAKCMQSNYHEFSSTPTRGVNRFTSMIPKYGYRAAVSAGSLRTEIDEMVVGPREWTMVLPCDMIIDSPIKIIKDFPSLSSLVFFNVSDLDISSTYPSVQVALNISKNTTLREIVKVEGLSEKTKRRAFVNLTCGRSNHVHTCRDLFNLPGLYDLGDIYLASKAT